MYIFASLDQDKWYVALTFMTTVAVKQFKKEIKKYVTTAVKNVFIFVLVKKLCWQKGRVVFDGKLYKTKKK